jgi:hypothetical protein
MPLKNVAATVRIALRPAQQHPEILDPGEIIERRSSSRRMLGHFLRGRAYSFKPRPAIMSHASISGGLTGMASWPAISPFPAWA